MGGISCGKTGGRRLLYRDFRAVGGGARRQARGERKGNRGASLRDGGKGTECHIRLFDTETTAVFAPFEIKTLRFFEKKAVEQDILQDPLLDKKLRAAYNKNQPSPKRRKIQP